MCCVVFCSAELGQCVQLRDMNLEHNEIHALPVSIGQLRNLQRLGLRYNRLSEVPASLANCTLLEEFNIENNQISTLPVCSLFAVHLSHYSVQYCTVLYRLCYIWSRIAVICRYSRQDSLLAHLTALQSITLARNNFAELPPGGAAQFTTVQTINMEHNSISRIPNRAFCVTLLLWLSPVVVFILFKYTLNAVLVRNEHCTLRHSTPRPECAQCVLSCERASPICALYFAQAFSFARATSRSWTWRWTRSSNCRSTWPAGSTWSSSTWAPTSSASSPTTSSSCATSRSSSSPTTSFAYALYNIDNINFVH